MDVWALMKHWDLVLPPSRPSAEQLRRISVHIKDISRSRPVAVLGSTPEFQDLLVEAGFAEVFVLERNLKFFEAMLGLRVHKGLPRLVEGDWLTTLDGLRNTFAVVLSDLTSGNVPYDMRPHFYNLVSSALAEGGLFIDKVLTHPGPHLTLSWVFEKYAQLPLNLLHINHFSCEALFCSELMSDREVVDSSAFYARLRDASKDARIMAFAEQAKRITPPGCMWWYGRRWSELEGDYCPNLFRLAIDDDDDRSPYYGRAKLFTLQDRREMVRP